MRLENSHYVKAEEGKRLILGGKDIGVAVWFAVGKSFEGIQNAASIEVRPMLFADEGMELVHKTTGERTTCVWLKGKSEDWVEEVIPVEEEIIEEIPVEEIAENE